MRLGPCIRTRASHALIELFEPNVRHVFDTLCSSLCLEMRVRHACTFLCPNGWVSPLDPACLRAAGTPKQACPAGVDAVVVGEVVAAAPPPPVAAVVAGASLQLAARSQWSSTF